METDDKLTPPKPDKSDTAHLIVRAVISGIPVAGGPAVEFFNALVSPSLEKRRLHWMQNVAEAIRQLEAAKRVSFEELQANQQFITVVMQASQSAIRNHQQEKLEALRNAILNSALPNPPEESLQIMFLSFIDAFTVWHLKILQLFQDPPRWAKEHTREFPNFHAGALAHVLTSAFPELEHRRDFCSQIWRDLAARGLVNTDTLHTMIAEGGLLAQRTTELGNQFMEFITEPKYRCANGS